MTPIPTLQNRGQLSFNNEQVATHGAHILTENASSDGKSTQIAIRSLTNGFIRLNALLFFFDRTDK